MRYNPWPFSGIFPWTTQKRVHDEVDNHGGYQLVWGSTILDSFLEWEQNSSRAVITVQVTCHSARSSTLTPNLLTFPPVHLRLLSLTRFQLHARYLILSSEKPSTHECTALRWWTSLVEDRGSNTPAINITNLRSSHDSFTALLSGGIGPRHQEIEVADVCQHMNRSYALNLLLTILMVSSKLFKEKADRFANRRPKWMRSSSEHNRQLLSHERIAHFSTSSPDEWYQN